MKMTHLKPNQFTVSRWSGGITTQIAIAPEEAVYADRDFLWRVSSATVELDASDFTPLPDYDRFICTLDGEMRLRHGGGEEIALQPYQVHRFDGATETHSEGRCTDFNLMVRKSVCRGSLRSIRLGNREREKLVVSLGETLLFYCAEGGGYIACGDNCVRLAAGEAALLETGESDVAVSGNGESSVLLLAQMWA